MTFGPVVCQKLAADFEKWEFKVSALNDSNFSRMYGYLWSTFAQAAEAGMVSVRA